MRKHSWVKRAGRAWRHCHTCGVSEYMTGRQGWWQCDGLGVPIVPKPRPYFSGSFWLKKTTAALRAVGDRHEEVLTDSYKTSHYYEPTWQLASEGVPEDKSLLFWCPNSGASPLKLGTIRLGRFWANDVYPTHLMVKSFTWWRELPAPPPGYDEYHDLPTFSIPATGSPQFMNFGARYVQKDKMQDPPAEDFDIFDPKR